MHDNLLQLVEALRLGRQCLRVIKQNVTFAVLFKIAVVAATFAGYAHLWLAIFADVGAMLAVTLNGVSILTKKAPSFARD